MTEESSHKIWIMKCPRGGDQTLKVRTALFWVTTRRVAGIPYRCFGAIYRYHPQGPRIWDSWPLTMGQIGCPETPVSIYRYSLRWQSRRARFSFNSRSKREIGYQKWFNKAPGLIIQSSRRNPSMQCSEISELEVDRTVYRRLGTGRAEVRVSGGNMLRTLIGRNVAQKRHRSNKELLQQQKKPHKSVGFNAAYFSNSHSRFILVSSSRSVSINRVFFPLIQQQYT